MPYAPKADQDVQQQPADAAEKLASLPPETAGAPVESEPPEETMEFDLPPIDKPEIEAPPIEVAIDDPPSVEDSPEERLFGPLSDTEAETGGMEEGLFGGEPESDLLEPLPELEDPPTIEITDLPAPSAEGSDNLLPWERPGGSPPPADTLLDDPMPTDEPEATESELPADDEWQPTPPTDQPDATLDSSQLTWMYASRLSYLLLAPEADPTSASQELAEVAKLLKIETPSVSNAGDDVTARIKQVLTAGRSVGASVTENYDAQHAALVEVAFKSNLLLAISDSKPQLKHSINAAVSAAAVRAGLPDTLWQPWQTRVAESSTSEELAEAVIDLHKQVGDYLHQSTARASEDEQPPVLR